MNAATRAGARAGGLKQSLSTFWTERNQRERRMLAVAAVVVVLGLIYALLIDPALSGREDLQKRLPTLRQQAAEVQALARQASAAPAAAAPAAAPPAVTRESLETSLSRKGLKAQNLSVTGELTKLQLEGVAFSALVEWLAEMQRGARLTVVDAKIDAQTAARPQAQNQGQTQGKSPAPAAAQPQPDTVNATLTLRQQRGEQTR